MTMPGLRTALRCLGHPCAWLSIGLLVLNDHVHKAAMPSWATGKLSDFAGLYFFPFLLAVALSLVLDRIGWPARRTGTLAFALTAGLFAAAKASPWGNALAGDVLMRAFAVRVSIVLDPTDLVALLALWPAWLLWRRNEQGGRGRPRPVPRGAWLALAAGALATVATSPCQPVPSMTYVIARDKWYMGAVAGENYEHLYSLDGGRTWWWLKEPPEGVPHATLPATACEPAPSRRCYRIDVPEQVEQSDDGGQTWSVAWQVPPERRDWVRRVAHLFKCVGSSPAYDPGPYALALDTRGGESTLVVAMGNEGALVRSPDGTWERFAVGSASPTPFAARSWDELLRVLVSEGRLNAWLGGAVLVLWVMSILAWWKIRATRRALFWGGAVALLALGISGFLLFPRSFQAGSLMICLLPGAYAGPLIMWLAVTWEAGSRRASLGLAVQSYIAALLVFPIGWLPMLLWAVGPISSYAVAHGLSVGVTLAGVACAALWVILHHALPIMRRGSS